MSKILLKLKTSNDQLLLINGKLKWAELGEYDNKFLYEKKCFDELE